MQRPRPPFVVGAFGARSLHVVATRTEGWSFAGRLGEPPESARRRFRELGKRLDELCLAASRAPADIRRSYLAGFADETPFSSADAFDEVTGRLAEAGADEIVFYYMSDAQQEMRSRGHRWIDRGTLEQLIADVAGDCVAGDGRE
jgi:alkanesulfonate monooxygenase SsuD/methylene tetrahydromethanopterin reductase-like flavin-dependent oxidoreductase (luciferase family)